MNKETSLVSQPKKSYYQRRREREDQVITPAKSAGDTFSVIMEGVILPTNLETDADINELSQQLLSITNKCVPIAVGAYECSPKKSNADALNLFISQSREITNDIRSLQNKKIQTNKIIKECLTPAFQQIHEQMLNIPLALQDMSMEDYEDEMKTFMALVVRGVCEKLKEML